MRADDIRAAVAAGDYRKAACLFEQYARSLSPNESTLAELRELMHTVKLSVLCARSHLQADIQSARDSLTIATAYRR